MPAVTYGLNYVNRKHFGEHYVKIRTDSTIQLDEGSK